MYVMSYYPLMKMACSEIIHKPCCVESAYIRWIFRYLLMYVFTGRLLGNRTKTNFAGRGKRLILILIRNRLNMILLCSVPSSSNTNKFCVSSANILRTSTVNIKQLSTNSTHKGATNGSDKVFLLRFVCFRF